MNMAAKTSNPIAGYYVPCGAWILSYHNMSLNGLVRNGVTRIEFVIMEMFIIVLESKIVTRIVLKEKDNYRM
jgi:hypothetical protein